MNTVANERAPVDPNPGPAAKPNGEPVEMAEPRYPGYAALALIWTAVGAVTASRHYFGPSSKPEPLELAWFIACTTYLFPWVALTPVVFRIERRFPLGPEGWARNLGALAAFSIPICLLAAPIMMAVVSVVLYAFGAPFWMPDSAVALVRFFPVAEAAFWASVAGGHVIRTGYELRAQEQRATLLALEKSRLEAGLNQAQLDALRARLNPHFLFNSLQNISVMTGQDPQIASRMLTRLGDLLRAVLRQDSRPETTLREEIELTRTYIAIEQMRFGDRLQVGFEIAPAAEDALVPCFLLQPLVENAVVHGLRGARRTGVITVSAVVEAGVLALTVRDNGIGPPLEEGAEMKLGVGLGSTCERLAIMYPDRHTLSMRRPPAGGAEVRITIPLRFTHVADQTHDDEQPAFADR